MIQAIIRFFFRKEVESYLKKVDSLVSDAEKSCKREYIQFERFDMKSGAFLHAMQPVFTSRAVISWLKTRQDEIYRLIKMGEVTGLQNYIGRALAIDAALKDLEDFESAYKDMLDEESAKKREGAHA